MPGSVMRAFSANSRGRITYCIDYAMGSNRRGPGSAVSNHSKYLRKCGGRTRARTWDPLIKSQLLLCPQRIIVVFGGQFC
jgi:hypothetical protein